MRLPTNRRLLLVALFVAGVLVGCGQSGGKDDERARALAIAAVLASDCGKSCHDIRATRIAPGLWNLSAVRGGERNCILVWIDDFERTAKNEYKGEAPMRCNLNS